MSSALAGAYEDWKSTYEPKRPGKYHYSGDTFVLSIPWRTKPKKWRRNSRSSWIALVLKTRRHWQSHVQKSKKKQAKVAAAPSWSIEERPKHISAENHLPHKKKKPSVSASLKDETRRFFLHCFEDFVLTRYASSGQLDALCSFMRERQVLEGEIVMRQGEPGEHLFLVASGRFESRVQHSSHQWQPSAGTFIPRRFQILQRQALSARSEWAQHGQFIRNYQAGEVFGQLALLYRCERPTTVVCTHAGLLWTLSRDAFTAAMCAWHENASRSPIQAGLQPQAHEWPLEPGNSHAFARLVASDAPAAAPVAPIAAHERTPEEQARRAVLTIRAHLAGGAPGPGGDDISSGIGSGPGSSSWGGFGGSTLQVQPVASARTVSSMEDLMLSGRLDEGDMLGIVRVRPSHLRQHSAHNDEFDALEASSSTTSYCGGRRTEFALKSTSKAAHTRNGTVHHAVNEVRILAELRHTFIVGLAGAHSDGTHLYQLRELVGYGDLNGILASSSSRRLPEESCRFYLANILLAIEHLHTLSPQRVAHRGLRPEALLVDGTGYLKLSGFEHARFVPSVSQQVQVQVDQHNSTGRCYTLCGSIPYMAPEMLTRMGHDERVDLWALGVIAFELLHGRTPFAAQSKSLRAPAASRGAAARAAVPTDAVVTDEEARCFATIVSVLEQPQIRYDSGLASPRAMDLIGCLLQRDPTHRITASQAHEVNPETGDRSGRPPRRGISSIRDMPFFDGMPWGLMLRRVVPPPLLPSELPPSRRIPTALEAIERWQSMLLRKVWGAWRVAHEASRKDRAQGKKSTRGGSTALAATSDSWQLFATRFSPLDPASHAAARQMRQQAETRIAVRRAAVAKLRTREVEAVANQPTVASTASQGIKRPQEQPLEKDSGRKADRPDAADETEEETILGATQNDERGRHWLVSLWPRRAQRGRKLKRGEDELANDEVLTTEKAGSGDTGQDEVQPQAATRVVQLIQLTAQLKAASRGALLQIDVNALERATTAAKAAKRSSKRSLRNVWTERSLRMTLRGSERMLKAARAVQAREAKQQEEEKKRAEQAAIKLERQATRRARKKNKQKSKKDALEEEEDLEVGD